jgi:putative transposase
MRRVAPSVLTRERLHELLDGARDRDVNLISDLVAAISELVMQELVEGEQADFLGGRGRYERRGEAQRGLRNGYEPHRVRTAEGPLTVQVPQVRGADRPFRSGLMGFGEGNSDVLDRLVTEMYARGMSTRDIEDAFRDVTGELLISRSTVSEISDRLWADYQEFTARDLSEIEVEYLFADAIFESLRRQGAKEALLVAWAIAADGRKHLLHLAVGNKESEACWTRVLPQHARPRHAAARHRHLRRCPRADQGNSGVFPSLDPDPVLVPLRRPRDYADLAAGAAGGGREWAGKVGIIRPC